MLAIDTLFVVLKVIEKLHLKDSTVYRGEKRIKLIKKVKVVLRVSERM